MKSNFTLFLGLFFFTTVLQAQNTKVPGFVTLQNSGGKSAFPLKITVSAGAQISKTNPATGYFEVSCPTSGEFFISVEKEGHEVVTPRATHVYFFEGKASVDTAHISINAEGAWLALADQYFRAGSSIVSDGYDAARAEIKKNHESGQLEGSSYRNALIDLQTRALRAWRNVTDVADWTAPTDADHCTPAYRSALRALGEKDITKAMGALAKARTKNEWVLRARLHTLSMQESAAYADYEAALQASTLDFQLTREYARYLMSDQKSLDKAKDTWKNALSMARHENERALALQGIGAVEATKNNLPEAVRYLEQAANIRDSLASSNAFFAADFGFTCRVLANYQMYSGKIEMAKSWGQKGATAWTKVPKPCSFSFCGEPFVLDFWLAGNPGRTKEEISQKLSNILHGLDQLAEHYSARAYLMKTYYLSQRAQQFQFNGDFARAMADWRELASICEEYETEWPVFIEQSQVDYWKFAPIAAQPNKVGGDEWMRSEGIARLRKASEQMPFFEIPLAYCLNEQGNGLAIQGKQEEALAIFEEVIRITEPSLALSPFDVVPIRGMALGLSGEIWFRKGEFDKGLALTDKAIAMNLNCQVCPPISKANFLSSAHYTIGMAYYSLKQDNENAERRFKEAHISYAEMVKMQPIKQNILKSYYNLSALNTTQMNLALKLEDPQYMQEIKKNIREQEDLIALIPDDPDFAQLNKELKNLKAMIKD